MFARCNLVKLVDSVAIKKIFYNNLIKKNFYLDYLISLIFFKAVSSFNRNYFFNFYFR